MAMPMQVERRLLKKSEPSVLGWQVARTFAFIQGERVGWP
jgi:hypothetical protein